MVTEEEEGELFIQHKRLAVCSDGGYRDINHSHVEHKFSSLKTGYDPATAQTLRKEGLSNKKPIQSYSNHCSYHFGAACLA